MKIKIDEEKCTGCGVCVDSCVQDVLRIDKKSNKAYKAYPEDCTNVCRLECELACPINAINISAFLN
ncbi:MAG: ferredoxin family protein [Dehalococcoidales bacterium]|nr:ferredoxin family protein [Dehalococcoidales bacterium]